MQEGSIAGAKENVVLVTGGTGLVGKNVRNLVESQPAEYEKTRFVFVGSKDADLCSEGDVRRLFEETRPTHVIHLAAAVGGLFKNLRYPSGMLSKNVAMNELILRYCHEFGVTKLVYCLSSCIFPDKGPFPLQEQDLHNGLPHDSVLGYGYSKRLMHVSAQLYNRQYGTNFVGLCPCNLFGKYDNFDPESGHVLAALVSRFATAEKELVVWGSGRPLRQFMYAPDFAKQLLWALEEFDGGEDGYLICSPPESEEKSINEIAEAIRSSMRSDATIVNDTSKADGQLKKTCSSAKFLAACPEFRFTPFQEAVQETVDWFLGQR